MIVNRVTLLGNKDHGKSTLIGSLLINTGSVSEQRINDAKKTSKKLGRQFEPGYILDSFQEERENEMTIDTTRAQVKYKDTGFEFIDVPGHEELMKNMLSGASYADFALLIVSAKEDEGITEQTKRHLFVAKLMGISRIIVAVNKLDAVGYDESRFEEITEGIQDYLEKIGFKSKEISFVPISAYNAENLVKRSKNMGWYKGSSLIDTLVSLSHSKKESAGKELVILLQGALEGDKRSIFGKVLSGSIKKGDKITVLPSGKEAKVREIFVSGRKKATASRGNVVTLEISNDIGKEVKGSVACIDENACKVGSSANALFFDTRPLKGRLSIKMNSVEIPCKKIEVSRTVDIATGETKSRGSVKPLQAAYIKLSLARSIAFEDFEKVPELGRFVLYSDKKFAGIGIIKD